MQLLADLRVRVGKQCLWTLHFLFAAVPRSREKAESFRALGRAWQGSPCLVLGRGRSAEEWAGTAVALLLAAGSRVLSLPWTARNCDLDFSFSWEWSYACSSSNLWRAVRRRFGSGDQLTHSFPFYFGRAVGLLIVISLSLHSDWQSIGLWVEGCISVKVTLLWVWSWNEFSRRKFLCKRKSAAQYWVSG